MPPEYHLRSFWDDRFETESHFEWLGDGEETLIPHLRTCLRSHCDESSGDPPRLLHIGAGTSMLSDRVREIYRDIYCEKTDESVIVNVDFSEAAVRKGVEAEMVRTTEVGGGCGMQWVQADMLQWEDLAPLIDKEGTDNQAKGLFEIVLDKSTSDAISCGDDILLHGSSSTSPGCPALERQQGVHEGRELRLGPVQLLALHLASLVRPGGIWIALSFSSSRFSFLQAPGTRQSDGAAYANPSKYWTLDDLRTVEAPSGQTKFGVHAPVIRHYVYILRRTHVLTEI